MNDIQNIAPQVSTLYEKITRLIEQARRHVATTVNTTEVYAKYHIGQYIVEEEQNGLERATYGKNILKKLSERLTKHFGDGWSYESLKLCRRFYVIYSNSVNGVYPIGSEKEKQCLPNSEAPKFALSWSHYLVLMRIENTDERSFYEVECIQQQWSVRQLSRQVGSSLYERLALSRNKAEVMRLAKEGQTIEKPSDIIKNPITLEFLGLKPEASKMPTSMLLPINCICLTRLCSRQR